MTGLLLGLFDEPEVDVSTHLPTVSWLILAAIGLLIAFFIVRPELWRRIWFQRVDPRPAGLMRIAFGLVVLVTFVDLLGPQARDAHLRMRVSELSADQRRLERVQSFEGPQRVEAREVIGVGTHDFFCNKCKRNIPIAPRRNRPRRNSNRSSSREVVS